MFYHFGLWAGKLAGFSSQALGMNGTSIPGMVGVAFDYDILKRLSKQVENIIIVTGTNGKTTTSNLISSIFIDTKMPFIDNSEGSNLITGVTASFINEADFFGKIKGVKYAILEVDEITLVKVLKKVTPKAIVITNFFRDQLDRFGEIDMLIQKMEDAIRPVNTKLILNADDPFSVRLSSLGKETVYFGLGAHSHTFQSQNVSESKFCPKCGKALTYHHVHFGQLGHFSCGCGFGRPNVAYEAEKLNVLESVEVVTKYGNFSTQLKGDYNAYNVMAAVACSKEFGISDDHIKQGLVRYRIENGRMQLFESQGHPFLLNLAKNPQGVNSSLASFMKDTEDKQVTIFLNDFGADGKDVSWIWDADYERLNRDDVKRVICSGRRAYDLAVRIEYANVPKEKIIILPNIQEAIDESVKLPINSYFLSTYTALDVVKETMEEHKLIKTI
jgi:UDP-N-acetylmuramyl tripeptide synthase